MKRYQKLLKHESVSQLGSTRSDFEFPTTSLGVQHNDVVFCGKVITRRVEPSSALYQTKRKSNRFVAGLRSPSGRENWCLRSGSDSSNKKIYSGMFGAVKFPLQMELSDIKMRQERKDPMSLPKLTTEDSASKSCWEMIRPLRLKGTLMSALKASFRCIRVV